MDDETNSEVEKAHIQLDSRVHKSYFLVVVLLVLVIGLGITIGITVNHDPANRAENATATTTLPTEYISPQPKRFVELIRKNPDGTKTPIIETRLDNADWIPPKVSQFYNYLIIYEMSSDKAKKSSPISLTIRSHDLDTGVTRELGTIDADVYDSIYEHVIGDRLFLMFPGYLQSNGVYSIDLPPVSNIDLITKNGMWGNIATIGDSAYLIGGTGDSCFGRTDYSLFDTKSKHFSPTFSSFGGCGYGTQILGFSEDNRVIMTLREEDKNEPTELGWFLGVYRNLYRIKAEAPHQQEILLSKADMPQNVKSIKYLKDDEKIALFGNEIYLYDILSKKLETIGVVPVKGLLDVNFQSLQDDKLCYSYETPEEGRQGKILELDIQTGQSSIRLSDCPIEFLTANPDVSNIFDNRPISLEAQIKRLKLPENYEAIYY